MNGAWDPAYGGAGGGGVKGDAENGELVELRFVGGVEADAVGEVVVVGVAGGEAGGVGDVVETGDVNSVRNNYFSQLFYITLDCLDKLPCRVSLGSTLEAQMNICLNSFFGQPLSGANSRPNILPRNFRPTEQFPICFLKVYHLKPIRFYCQNQQ